MLHLAFSLRCLFRNTVNVSQRGRDWCPCVGVSACSDPERWALFWELMAERASLLLLGVQSDVLSVRVGLRGCDALM